MLTTRHLIRREDRSAEQCFDSITLDSDGRHLRRLRVTSDGGLLSVRCSLAQ